MFRLTRLPRTQLLKPLFAKRFLSYTIAEAYSAKPRPPHQQSKPPAGENRPPTGEDAFFHVSLSKTDSPDSYTYNSAAFGVTDGVGGWAEMGVNSSDFSYYLCHESSNLAVEKAKELEQEGASNDKPLASLISPKQLLVNAYEKIVREKTVKAGGSTACIGVAGQDGQVAVANLGDSGFMVFRNGKLAGGSKAQTHAFNTPYQLAIIPDELKRSDERQGLRHIEDTPAAADQFTFTAEPGDVIVLATDGLTDNMSAQDTLKIVNETMLEHGSWIKDDKEGIKSSGEHKGAMDLARRIVLKAKSLSTNKQHLSPFAKEVQQVMKVHYMGGKPDDITVLVVIVNE